jgi:hypothetical protein
LRVERQRSGRWRDDCLSIAQGAMAQKYRRFLAADRDADGRCEQSPGGMLVFGVTLAESLKLRLHFGGRVERALCMKNLCGPILRTILEMTGGGEPIWKNWPHARLRRGSFESLQISLNYKAEPNWLTYCKLQELADRVELELRNQGLNPRSRIDVQGFIWASISIEDGKYGSTD